MAIDINEQVANAYEAAKQALNDDLKQNLYNATQARVQAFRQINNNANAQHAMYSGMPSGAQMQYDRDTYIPNIGKMAVSALSKQEENQEKWDKYMSYINELQAQADYYNSKANQINSSIPSSSSGGFSSKPTTTTNKSAQESFSSSGSGGNGNGFSGGGSGGGGGGVWGGR